MRSKVAAGFELLTNPDDMVAAESRQADSTRGIGNEVLSQLLEPERQGSKGDDTHQESGNVGNDTTICSETVGDGTHTVLTDTIADVSTSVRTEASAGVLEIGGVLDLGQVAASKIGGATKQLRKDRSNGGEDDLRKLSGGNSGISRLVHGKGLVPALRERAGDAALEFGVLFGVLLAISGDE